MPIGRKVLSQEQALIDAYKAAEVELTAQVLEAITAKQAGTAAYRARRLEAIRQALSDLQDKTVPAATALTTDAYLGAAREAARQLGGPAAAENFGTGLHLDAMNLLADNITSGLNGAAELVGRRVEDQFRQVGLRAVSQELAKAGTLRDKTASVVDAFAKQGITAFEDAAGRSWALDRYAEMVVRTTTAEANNLARVNTFLENGVDLVEIDVSGSACDVCAEYDGAVFSLTGETPGYDILPAGDPPFHPNCRCEPRAAPVALDAYEASLDAALNA